MGWHWYPSITDWLTRLAQMPDDDLLAEAQQPAEDINSRTLLLSEIRARGLWPAFRRRQTASIPLDSAASDGERGAGA